MLQLKRDLFEIQEHAYELYQMSNNILNPTKSYNKYLYHYTDGTQYIDTNIKVDDSTIIELQFRPLTTDNSFICGTDELALFIINSMYVFIVGSKLYVTDTSANTEKAVLIQLSRNGLVINNKAYRTSGTIYFTSDNTILIGAGYDNSISRVFSTLNSIDDVVDVSDNQENVDNEQLMITLNDIDGATDTYDGDILQNNGINALSSKAIYYYKIYKNNNIGIRECVEYIIPVFTIEQEVKFYDIINREYIETVGEFLRGAQDIVDGIAYSIDDIPDVLYNFKLNNSGYYESTNKGIHSSYALTRLNFNVPEGKTLLEIDCINYAESGYDYGILSKVDTPLSLSNTDSTDVIYKTFNGSTYNLPTVQPVLYNNLTSGNHFIDIKYRKDGSGNSYNDSLQFKIVPPIANVYTVTKPDSGSYTFTWNSSGYYESNNKGVSNSYALAKVTFFITSATKITVSCVNSGESSYDYGILSNLDTTLTSSSSADSSNVKKSFYGQSSSSWVNVDYTGFSTGEHFIYVKFRKDGSVNSGNDSLRFKIIFS